MRRVIRVEQGTFTPLVFATSGGFAPEVGKVLQRAAEKICARRKEGYAETMTFIKQKLRFSLLRSTLVALRGTKRRTAFARLEETDFRDVGGEMRLPRLVAEGKVACTRLCMLLKRLRSSTPVIVRRSAWRRSSTRLGDILKRVGRSKRSFSSSYVYVLYWA